MRTIVTGIIMILGLQMMAQEHEKGEFWADDKMKHSVGSFGISAITYTYLSYHKRYQHLSELEKRVISFSTTMLVGTLKEVTDKYSSNGVASWADMGANAIGAITFQATVTIPISIKKRKKRIAARKRLEKPALALVDHPKK
ncbi:hypothetical protein ACFSTE_08870 [Aquimarina hainanensis]|uniref:VanZ like family protein n=1 Tax=Aquimarina hainanensis TaxID=1578017 RepID=A0ABW5N8Z7_9FLAO